MNLEVDVERLTLAHKAVRAELLSERAADGHWVGHLDSSPFATAAAVSALVVAHHRDSKRTMRESTTGDGQAMEQVVQNDLSELLLESVHWLARQQNPDGGWSDCEGARSNIAATLLVQAAFRLTGIPAKFADLMDRADEYVEAEGGFAALRRQCNGDKTLLAAIMANCALADMVSWRQVPTLQLELACLPTRWRRNIQVSVPRYARPVVLAVGRAKFHHDPPKNPISRLLRRSIWTKSLTILEQMQASDDSFLASVPLTAFVVMSLGSIGCQEHPTVERGIEFLLSSVRADSSWSNTPNRAISNTALALNSFSGEPEIGTSRHQIGDETHEAHRHFERHLESASSSRTWDDTTSTTVTLTDESLADIAKGSEVHDGTVFSETCLNWLLDCQRTEPNALTEVSAGGWASGDAAGAPPNASATAGVLLALAHSHEHTANLQRERVDRAAGRGVVWLLELQNEDRGWATFYRDDSLLRRDESGTDVTAQAVRALAAWRRSWRSGASEETHRRWHFIDERVVRNRPRMEISRIAPADRRQLFPIVVWQRTPAERAQPRVWHGSSFVRERQLERLDSDLAQRAARWLVAAQHTNGGWGPPRAPVDYSGSEKDGSRAWRGNDAMALLCSVEETSLAISALITLADSDPAFSQAVSRGLTWLAGAVEQDGHRRPAIIGFSLAKLWYHERLYPLAFAAGALSRAVRGVGVATPAASHVG